MLILLASKTAESIDTFESYFCLFVLFIHFLQLEWPSYQSSNSFLVEMNSSARRLLTFLKN